MSDIMELIKKATAAGFIKWTETGEVTKDVYGSSQKDYTTEIEGVRITLMTKEHIVHRKIWGDERRTIGVIEIQNGDNKEVLTDDSKIIPGRQIGDWHEVQFFIYSIGKMVEEKGVIASLREKLASQLYS